MTANDGEQDQQPIQLYEPTTQRVLEFKKAGVEPEKLSLFADKIAKSVPANLEDKFWDYPNPPEKKRLEGR